MHYRIYLLGVDDHISKARDVDCPTDAAVFAEIAPIIGNSSAAEVWCGKRCVGKWTSVEIEVVPSGWAENEAAVACGRA
jgi:hypothetical protein